MRLLHTSCYIGSCVMMSITAVAYGASQYGAETHTVTETQVPYVIQKHGAAQNTITNTPVSAFTTTAMMVKNSSSSSYNNKIIAIVGTKPITVHDLTQRINLILFLRTGNRIDHNTITGAMLDHIRKEAIEALITSKIVQLESQRTNIFITEDEIDAGILNIAEKNNISSANLVSHIKSAQVLEEFRDFVMVQLFLQKFVHLSTADLVFVTDNEIHEVISAEQNRKMEEVEKLQNTIAMINNRAKKNYNDTIPSTYHITPEDVVTLSLLTINIPSANSSVAHNTHNTEGVDNTIHKLVLDIEQGIKNGLRFEELSKKYTPHSNIIHLKHVKISDLSPDYLKTVLKLKKGSYSMPFVVDKTVHLIMLLDIHHRKAQQMEETAKKLLHQIKTQQLSNQEQIVGLMHNIRFRLYTNLYLQKMRQLYWIEVYDK